MLLVLGRKTYEPPAINSKTSCEVASDFRRAIVRSDQLRGPIETYAFMEPRSGLRDTMGMTGTTVGMNNVRGCGGGIPPI